ncbi:hypothetical protein Hanom_Chr02g00106451 [Helianthus anomalus]
MCILPLIVMKAVLWHESPLRLFFKYVLGPYRSVKMHRCNGLDYRRKKVNYIVSPCGLHKITYLDTNSLKSPSRVLTFHFVTFEGINF